MRSPQLRIRTRVALWCALLVTASAVVVLIGALVLTQHTLDQHAPRPSLSNYSNDPVELRSEQFAAVEANRILVENTTAHVRNVGLIGLAGLAVLSLAVGWLVAGRMLAPATRLAGMVSTMNASDLGHRVHADGPRDELRVLSDAFDGMLDRLDRSFERQRRFVADASHELRTPFAALRTQVDVALDRDLDRDELRGVLDDIGAVLDRGAALVNAMLALSRAETLATRQPVDLRELTSEVLTTTPGVEGLDLRTHLAPARLSGDPVLLEQLVGNLVRNAVAYNRPGGLLLVDTEADDSSGVIFRIANDGLHLSPDDVEQFASRFRRGPTTRHAVGFGLGVSIVDAIATTHDATLEVEPRPAGGLLITVTFPQGDTSLVPDQSGGR